MVVGVKIGEAKKIAKKYESLGYVYIKSEIVDNEYMKLIFQDPIASEENNTTDIQFYEGDFVENKDTRFCFKSISQLLKWFNRKNENDINVLKLLRKKPIG